MRNGGYWNLKHRRNAGAEAIADGSGLRIVKELLIDGDHSFPRHAFIRRSTSSTASGIERGNVPPMA